MSRLTRDGTAEPVSRDQILRHARGQGNINFPCSADHEQDWQPYPVDPYSAICDDHTYIHTYITVQSGLVILVCVCVCVCVFFPFILDIKFVRRTSRGHTGGRSHRIFIHLLSALRALIFLAKRIQPFLYLVDREDEFCVVTI